MALGRSTPFKAVRAGYGNGLLPHSRTLVDLERRYLYGVTAAVFLIGVWLHIPYGGGHIYSDIPTLFQIRECTGACLTIHTSMVS
jgi:hypothetical protein